MTSILKADTIQDADGNNIINENSNTITIGASGDTTNIIGTLQNNGSAVASTNGITEADQWRLNTAFNGAFSGASSGFLTSNLERVDSAGWGKIGTGMSESSGVFTFPSTGIWLVNYSLLAYASTTDGFVQSEIYITTNNSSYNEISRAYLGIETSGDTTANSGFTQTLIDVTDTSNVKVKFAISSLLTSTYIYGTTDSTATGFTFIRLGDT